MVDDVDILDMREEVSVVVRDDIGEDDLVPHCAHFDFDIISYLPVSMDSIASRRAVESFIFVCDI
jgi:hypothetical protein